MKKAYSRSPLNTMRTKCLRYRLRPFQYSPLAYNFIVLVINQLMDEPVDVQVDATVEQLAVRLRRCLGDFSSGLLRGDRQVDTRMLGPYRTFTASSYFSLDEIWIVHRFLAENDTPPTGKLSITLVGIRQKLLEHALCLRPAITPPPTRRDRRSGRRQRSFA